MRQAGRVAAAIEILQDIETQRRPASLALKDWGRTHRFAGSGDRAAIGNLVFDALRKKTSIAWRMHDGAPRAALMGVLRWSWGMEPDELSALFSGTDHAPVTLTQTERDSLVNGTLEGAPDWIAGDYPECLHESFARIFGARAGQEGAAMAERAPVDLRANTLKHPRDKVVRALERFKAKPCDLSPVGIRLPAPVGAGKSPAVQADAAFGKGWFEVQDEGSQLAALLTGAKAGMQVADLCAGAGGKTLALAAMMDNKGQLHAYDADRHRLKKIWDRLRRAGTRNIQVIEPGAGAFDPLRERMDIVVVDAPCSGSGTWRRKPDTKWRLSEKILNARLEDQVKILESAVPLVKPGGKIVYITCSVLPEENGDQVDVFLARHPDFAPGPLDPDLLSAIHARRGEAAPALESTIQLTPLRDSTDGFFIASLIRKER